MGSIQCTSSRNSNITLEIIEKRILNNNSPLEKKIHDEYFYVKNLINDSSSRDYINKKDTLLTAKKGKSKLKLIIQCVPPKKRLERFLKWSQMIYSVYSDTSIKTEKQKQKLSSPEVKVKRKYLKKILDISPQKKRSSNSPVMFDFPQNISIIPKDSDVNPSANLNLNSSSVYMDNNYHSIASNTSFTATSWNIYEENLSVYFQLHKHQFLERLSKGPPDSLRWINWLIAARIPKIRNEDVFLLHLYDQVRDEVDQQIKKDLSRTLLDSDNLVDNISINSHSTSQGSLYKVLKALSSADKDVSYCQGMNFISGFLLLISEFNEIDTFYMLIGLFSHTFSNNFGIRGFFSEKFPLLNAYLYIFNYFFAKRMPELKLHFQSLDIPEEMWIGKWIQTLYTICLPLNVTIRIWDCLFSFGLDFIVPFSISLLEILEKDLLKLEDSFDVIDYFKEVMSPVGGKRNPTLGSQSKTYNSQDEDNNDIVNVEMIIDHAKKLYKCMNKSVISSIKREFESKYNIDLEIFQKKYDMTMTLAMTMTMTMTISPKQISPQKNIKEEKRAKILPLNTLIESQASKKSTSGFASSYRTPKSTKTFGVATTLNDIVNVKEMINDIHPMISPISTVGISNSNNILFQVKTSSNTNISIIDDDCIECDEFDGMNTSQLNSNKMTSHVLRSSIGLTDKNS